MNRREFIGGAAASIVLGAECSVLGAEDALEKSKKWFKEAQFGMMAHWGLYTLLGGEWKGKPGKHAYGEWIMEGNRIPLKEYAALAKAFNPILFDPMDWMKRARDAGMKYFVITSKHHDGFAMYRSRVSKYNVVDATIANNVARALTSTSTPNAGGERNLDKQTDGCLSTTAAIRPWPTPWRSPSAGRSPRASEFSR